MTQSEACELRTGWIMLFGIICLAFICLNRNQCIKQEPVTTSVENTVSRDHPGVILPVDVAVFINRIPAGFSLLSEDQSYSSFFSSLHESKRNDVLLKFLHNHTFVKSTLLPCIRSVCPASPDDEGLS